MTIQNISIFVFATGIVGCYMGPEIVLRAGSGESSETTLETSGSETDDDETCVPETDPTRATLRRLTRNEYNNTLRDLLGDTSFPGNTFPSEELSNGFGNDANAQTVSSLLAEQYNTVAENIAVGVAESPEKLKILAECASSVTDTNDTETIDACAEKLIEDFVSRAYRRPLDPQELNTLLEFATAVRNDTDFATSIASVIELVLQSPDFLYRVEHGILDEEGRRRPTDHEMATRLSYLMWATMPDPELRAAADAKQLSDPASILAHAQRMLDDPRSRPVLRFFFDNLLPISALASLQRDPERYPAYTPAIGSLLREETQRFMEHEIFEGSGTWDGAITAPYTFVNGPLADFYGIEGVTGEGFVKVDLDTSQRLGLLTHAGVVAGTIHSNETNPVVRGAFIMRNIMCTDIPLPSGDLLAEIKPPDPDSGATARERFGRHSDDPVCAGCHSLMDPVGLTLENYDPIGLWRDTENGVSIDATGSLPGVMAVDGPVELAQAIASAPRTHTCFATQWSEYAYGRTHSNSDACALLTIDEQFAASGHNIRQLLLDLTQTDDFLFLPVEAN